MKKLDRFILRDILSDGPAGTVYRADEVLPGDNRRPVALKVLPPIAMGNVAGESEAELRFFGEVKVLAQLAVHPHIATIYAMGITDAYPWLAMELAPRTLQDKIGENPADPAEVWRVLENVARGLCAMHALKPPLIHQDLKPANILIDPLGHLKITDFSLATVTAANKTHGLATVRYAAPELLSSEFGRVGPATDLYALGHIAYELAVGWRRHRQQFPAVFEGNVSKEPPPNKWMMWHASMGLKPADIANLIPEFPARLSDVIARLMAKSLDQRYSSAEELLGDLSILRSASDTSAVSESRAATPTRPPSMRAAIANTETAPVVAPPAAPPKTDKSSPVMGSGGHYWVRLRGKVTGPFDLPTLQRQVKQGQISRLHQISSDQVTWKRASDVEGLYGPSLV